MKTNHLVLGTILALLVSVPRLSFGMADPISVESIAPIEGSQNMKVQFSTPGGTYTYVDDDGMVSLIVILDLQNERSGPRNADWDEVKNQPVADYEKIQPFLVRQLRFLKSAYQTWSKNPRRDPDKRRYYSQSADDVEALIQKLPNSPAASNSTINAIRNEISRLSEVHTYDVIYPSGTIESSQAIDGDSNPVAHHYDAEGTMCDSSISGDIVKLSAMGSSGSNGAGETGGSSSATQ